MMEPCYRKSGSNNETDGKGIWPPVQLLNTSDTGAATKFEKELRQKYKFKGHDDEPEKDERFVIIGTKCGDDRIRDAVLKCLKDRKKDWTRRIFLIILQGHQNERHEAIMILDMGYLKGEGLYLADAIDSALGEIGPQTSECETQKEPNEENMKKMILLIVSHVHNEEQPPADVNEILHINRFKYEGDYPYTSIIDAVLREIIRQPESSLTHNNKSDHSTSSEQAQSDQMRSDKTAAELSAYILTPDSSPLTDQFEEQFKAYIEKRSVTVQRLQNGDTIDNDMRLFVVCNVISRAQTDLNNCLKGISDIKNGRMVLVVLHSVPKADLPKQSTGQFLEDNAEEGRTWDTIIEMAYLPGHGIYRCKMNELASKELDKLIGKEKSERCIIS